MPVKRLSKTFEEIKKELEAEATSEEELTNKLGSIVSDIFESYLNPEIKYEYDVAVDPSNDYVLTIKLSNSGIELEDAVYELDAIFSKVFSIPPKDKAMKIEKNKAIVVYRIIRQILVKKRITEVKRELDNIELRSAIEAYKSEKEIGEMLRKLMERKNES